MNTFCQNHRRDSRGVALIFVIFMIVILTLLVVFILSRATVSRQISFSSAGQQKADQMAQAGLQEILNDLRQEIAAGSGVRTSSATTTYNSQNVALSGTGQSTSYNSQNVYIPSSNQTVVPAFAGYSPTAGNDPFPNLLKRSAYNIPFFTGTSYNATLYPPSQLASPLNTGSATSIDGRFISRTRWNKPMLMTPSQLAGFTPPDWVYVSRGGPLVLGTSLGTGITAINNPVGSNTNYVVGRYAYAVYDEGGLLDANTAGCAAALVADFDRANKRGRLGQADLTALPGLGQQSDVDKVINWRNATTSGTAASYFNYLFHCSSVSGTNLIYNTGTATDPTFAFTTVPNGDQTFTSRQDLLSFFDFTFGAGSSQEAALPYLGTFSRELNAPSYCPPNPGGNPGTVLTTPSAQYKYADNAEQTSSINRNFPGVKFYYGGTLTTDGTTVVHAGDPLVRRRFALSRIQLLQNKMNNPADTSNDTLIQKYFGLIYNTSTGKWTYTSPDSAAVATSIKTLDQVAQINPPRAPDFFEMLQAGILNGSLGKTTGTDLNGNSTSGSETVAYDSRPDFQIIQIGVNIIDQYGSGNVPSTITYGGTPTGAQGPDFYDFYGIKNIPYISKINQVIYREEKPGMDPVSGYGNPYNSNKPWDRPWLAGWLQFELWNPHQNPQAAAALPLRVYAVGSVSLIAFNSNDNNGGNAFVLWDGNPNPNQLAVAYGTATFTSSEYLSVPASAYAAADYFREPATLASSSLNVTNSFPADHLQQVNYFSGSSGWDFIGLKTGEAFAPDGYAMETGYPTYTHPSKTGEPLNPSDAGITAGPGGVTFYLQCENPAGSGNWKTIQRVKNCVIPPDSGTPLPSLWLKGLQPDCSWMAPSHSLAQNQAGQNYTFLYNGAPMTKSAYRMLPDPRTDRFGVFESYREQPNLSPLTGPSFNETLLPSVLGNTTRGLFGYYWARGRMRMPNTYSYLSGGGGTKYTSNGWVDGYDTVSTWGTVPNGAWASLLMFNTQVLPSKITGGVTSFPFTSYYYADNDGIIRGGDAWYADGLDHDGNGFPDGFSAYMGSVGTPRPERPLILNRPFRSVGELGYVHRGELWKSLDFFTPDSADAGLLDLFSIDEEDVVAGTVDLNTRQAPVLQAVLQGAVKNETAVSASDPGDPVLSGSDASALASLLIAERLGAPTGPLANRSELVTRFLAQNIASTNYTAFPLNKTRREAVVRPLAAVGNTGTWNLLIDIIAQSGRYPVNATNNTQFQIQGEKRYWWHVAIDRFTGQIVASQLEPVYE